MTDSRRTVEEAIGRFASGAPVVLAVSGGRDSMVLLHAMARAHPGLVAAVATFDHGTGVAATRAAELVAGEAKALGLPVRRGRARAAARTEAAWRAARWAFLHSVAADLGAAVATAHTREDQIETVIMRILRGSGARGLAGLYADSPVLRPILDCDGETVLAYARAHDLRWVEDPTNVSRSHLRNRIRLDLRPALERTRPRPGFSLAMLRLSLRAAELRREVEHFVASALPVTSDGRVALVARASLLHYDAKGLAMLWPAIAARIGIALDRRGAGRLSALAREGRAGARIQLSGGFEALLHRGMVVLRTAKATVDGGPQQPLAGDEIAMGSWRFRRRKDGDDSLWNAELPLGVSLTVRPWRPGDRMTPLGADVPRRVKGLLRDAGIDAGRRAGWPVVLAGNEIVWIPGVRRSLAATARSGRPVVRYFCEPLDDR